MIVQCQFCIFIRSPQGDLTMSLHFYNRFSKYKYLIVNLLIVFSHLVFGVGSQKGLLADIEWAPYDFHFKFADTLRFPSDLRTVLIQDVGSYELLTTLTYTVTNVVAHDYLRCLEIGGKIADRKFVR